MSAKIDLRFLDVVDKDNSIKVEKETCQWFSVKLGNVESDVIRIVLSFEGDETYIDLDKSTSIKFAKTLRTEINKIQ